MALLAVEILAAWSLISFATSLAVGAAIGKGDRVRKDEFLSAVYSTLERMQASGSLNTRAV